MLEASLRRQAEALGIAGRVHFAGPQKAPEVARWMNACDVFCLPSATEGCPNVILEALACGRPVVATAVGGIPEIVTPRCGILVADDEAGRLAEALADAACRGWKREEIAAFRQRGWEQVAQETYEACEQAWRETRAAQ
jgi:glycosyltransferase involved in cell wall biosynthesis